MNLREKLGRKLLGLSCRLLKIDINTLEIDPVIVGNPFQHAAEMLTADDDDLAVSIADATRRDKTCIKSERAFRMYQRVKPHATMDDFNSLPARVRREWLDNANYC